MRTNQFTRSLVRVMLFIPAVVLAITATFVPKLFHTSVRADGCGACGGPGQPGGICTYPCPPCEGGIDGPFSCGEGS